VCLVEKDAGVVCVCLCVCVCNELDLKRCVYVGIRSVWMVREFMCEERSKKRQRRGCVIAL
jgi:hypothetical protein